MLLLMAGMPVTYELKDGLFWIHFSGILDREEFAALFEVFEKEEGNMEVIPHRLSDLTELSAMNINFEDILNLARTRRAIHFPNNFKSAIVAANEVQLGFARMFQTLNTNPQIEIQIFDDAESALKWLR